MFCCILQEIQAVDNALRKNTLGGHGVSLISDISATVFAHINKIICNCLRNSGRTVSSGFAVLVLF